MFRSTIGLRTEREQREDEEFIQALRKIPTLKIRDGCMSMDPSDLQEELKALHEAGRRLIDGQARS